MAEPGDPTAKKFSIQKEQGPKYIKCAKFDVYNLRLLLLEKGGFVDSDTINKFVKPINENDSLKMDDNFNYTDVYVDWTGLVNEIHKVYGKKDMYRDPNVFKSIADELTPLNYIDEAE